MKTTTRLFDVIQTELIERGQNEFYNKINGIDQLTYFMPQYAFMRKIMLYDDTVKEVLDFMIYNDFVFPDPEVDVFFKKAFINKFVAREIGQETIELFASQLTFYIITHEQYITTLCKQYNAFLTGETTSSNNQDNTNGTNSATGTLPQDTPTLNLKSDTFDYANEANASRGFNNTSGNTKSNTYNNSNLHPLMTAWDALFKEIDARCFLQTF